MTKKTGWLGSSQEKSEKPKGRSITRRVSRKEYERMIELVREHGAGLWATIAREIGVTPATVKTYYRKGNSAKGWKSIEQVLADEQKEARALLAKEKEIAADEKFQEELARAQSVQSRKEEGALVGSARKSATQVLESLCKIGEGVQFMAAKLNEQLSLIAQDEERFNPEKAMVLIRRYAWAMKDACSAAHQTMEMERLFLGEPQKTIGLQLSAIDEMSVEQMASEIHEAAQALDRAKITSGSHLQLVQGGQGGAVEALPFDSAPKDPKKD